MNNLEYCTWAYNAVQSYYDTLLNLEHDYPYTDLRMTRGQIAWTIEEMDMWEATIEEDQ